jgi:hypothetical protein
MSALLPDVGGKAALLLWREASREAPLEALLLLVN